MLFFSLAVLIVVLVLINVLLSAALNQGHIVKHQLARTQALYAALGGVSYVFDQLRVNNWTVVAPDIVYELCDNSDGVPSNCYDAPLSLPRSISKLSINISDTAATAGLGTARIFVTANYTQF
ncbi:MAG: hypothetical protein V1490_01875 [Candidatus Omnitrophota bacterium]|nr:hypothetical protein [Candidatus Omnitrophota bacterium]